jgi:ribosomal protein S27E
MNDCKHYDREEIDFSINDKRIRCKKCGDYIYNSTEK